MPEDKQLDRMESQLNDMHNVLFVDDGNSPCWQTKIDRNTRWIGSVKWLYGLVIGGIVSFMVYLFKD